MLKRGPTRGKFKLRSGYYLPKTSTVSYGLICIAYSEIVRVREIMYSYVRLGSVIGPRRCAILGYERLWLLVREAVKLLPNESGEFDAKYMVKYFGF